MIELDIDGQKLAEAIMPYIQLAFDYSEYSPDLALSLEQHAVNIEGLTKRYAADMGKEFAEAKAEIHTEKQTGWAKWVEGRIGISVQHADRCIAAYKKSELNVQIPPTATVLTEEDHYMALVDEGLIEYSSNGHSLVKERDRRNIDNIPIAVPHISSKNNEWYTPAKYINAARELMRGIDLDPASCEQANETVAAANYYDITQDGLSKPWHGRIWLNPPYGYTRGESNQALWSNRLIQQYQSGVTKEAVLLVNAAVDTNWFHDLLAWFPVCLTRGRINFTTPESTLSGSTHGSAFVYFGPQPDRFYEIFSEFGTVVRIW